MKWPARRCGRGRVEMVGLVGRCCRAKSTHAREISDASYPKGGEDGRCEKAGMS